MAKVDERVGHSGLVGGAQTTLHSHAGGGGEAEVVLITTADVANSTVTFANITGLTFEMLASKTYIIEAWLIWQSADVGTGIKVALNGPASPVAVALIAQIPVGITLYASDSALASRAYNTGTPSTGIDAAVANSPIKVDAIVRNGPNAGTLALRFASESTPVVVTIKAGSVLRYRQVD